MPREESVEIEFLEPEESPRPPEEVRFRSAHARPYPDGRRVRVEIELTPFQLRPTIELALVDRNGEELASTTVVEAVATHLELTLHLRREAPPGPLTARFSLLYPESGRVDGCELQLDLQQSGPHAEPPAER